MMSFSKHLGNVPIMVRSNRCHLENASPSKLISHHEESEEFGGYFIVNGIERIIRLLVVTRRNHALAIFRPSFAKKGPQYSSYGVLIRCVRDDQTSHTLTMHYLTDGNLTVRFSYRKQEYLVPLILILKALKSTNDKEIFDGMAQSETEDTFLLGRIEMLLREFKRYKLYTKAQCLTYLGSRFSAVLRDDDDLTDEQIGLQLLKKVVLVHLESDSDKFNFLIFMARKLYALVAGKCAPDNPDSPMHHELLMSGHLYAAFMKEKMDEMLLSLRNMIVQDMNRSKTNLSSVDEKYMKRMLLKTQCDIGKKMQYFLATGNLPSMTGMDLQQTSGYTVVAERLNFYRYISHFRSVHRGSFFAELKTTTVRKLLPEAWGFLCPVHTPDGAPCGLLNHLSHTCQLVTNTAIDHSGLPLVLASLGVTLWQQGIKWPSSFLNVQINGRVVGFVSPRDCPELVAKLRYLKVTRHASVPPELEIATVLPSNGGLYPGLFLFTSPSRMMRPVLQLATKTTELIGSFEQVYLNIAIATGEMIPGQTTHQEIAPTHMLSVIANLTPFSDFNQSPRNMYQCQMGKQSMGTPCHAFPYRTDNKLYRLHTGQTPLVRPKLHDTYGMDLYPNGANAVVAVISYTGYDMEDAMIINKSSYERGFGHGSIYKCEVVDLAERSRRDSHKVFRTTDTKLIRERKLDADGLPIVGQRIRPDDPFVSIFDEATGETKVQKFKGLEEAYVEQVSLIGDETGSLPAQKANIKLRIPRNPVIGDKFSSRHGQKGVLSQKWPAVDMPFSESGILPDVIINPHAFPSRMTIGMFVESLAGKSGALHGLCQEATPFQFSEDQSAASYFGAQLIKAGYNYYGNEPMYSGVMGTEMKADIYIGVVYYQRLRHMVSDKFQVRTTGPVHNLTHQPVKGRKRAGGIRFGEMERDSLLAHGVSFLLHDRLMNCSDYSQMYVCDKCGGLLSILSSTSSQGLGYQGEVECRECQSKEHIKVVAMPYVFRYLSTELMAMNIRLKLNMKKN